MMKNHENLTIVNNIHIADTSKSLIRATIAKNVFLADFNNNVHVIFNKKKPAIGTFENSTYRTLTHKRLKSLRINAYIANNRVSPVNNQMQALVSLFKSQKKNRPVIARILSPVRGGYFIITARGVIGFIYRKQIKEMSRILRFFTRRRKGLPNYFLYKKQHNMINFAKTNFLVKLIKAKYKLPNLKVSRKYFIPKEPGQFSLTFTSIFKNKKLTKANNSDQKDKNINIKAKNRIAHAKKKH